MPRLQVTLCVLATALVLAGEGAGRSSENAAGPYRNGLVAFVRCCGPETGVYVVRPDGTGERRVFAPRADDAPLTPAWSPDGKRIAFVPGAPRGGLRIMDGNGAGQRRVTPGQGDPLFPSFAPGGVRIVFADLRRPGPQLHDLYIVRTDGSGLKRLTGAGADETHPAWAPNGGEIVYERGCDLWRMRADGSRQRLLLRNGASPSWSPGGTHIAFLRRGAPWVTSRNGTGAKRVVEMREEQAGVAWSPDGRWLVTAPLARGELTLVRADGSQTQPLTDAPGYGQSWPSWQRLARP